MTYHFLISKERESFLATTLTCSTRVKHCYSNQVNISMYSLETSHCNIPPCIMQLLTVSSVRIICLQSDSQMSSFLNFRYPILQNPCLRLCLEICSWSGIFLFQSLNYFNYDIGEGRESLKILIYLEQEYIYTGVCGSTNIA